MKKCLDPGMGSSATARVVGLAAALHFSGIEVPLRDQLTFLADEEGHPDNVVPARVGGLTLCADVDGEVMYRRYEPPAFGIALCIPDHEVQTPAARAILPAEVPHGDAVFNVSRVAFLIAGLLTRDSEAIALGLGDRLHQPYRKALIGPVDEAFAAAREAGALGAFVSGSGSTLAAFVAGSDPTAVAEAMANVFRSRGTGCDARAVTAVSEGLIVLG